MYTHKWKHLRVYSIIIKNIKKDWYELKKVFIVEDDVNLAEDLSESLKKWGFNVAVTKEFDNILEQFMEEKPQIVLMDVNLPFFDGFTGAKK